MNAQHFEVSWERKCEESPLSRNQCLNISCTFLFLRLYPDNFQPRLIQINCYLLLMTINPNEMI